jgi:hypothetical protein
MSLFRDPSVIENGDDTDNESISDEATPSLGGEGIFFPGDESEVEVMFPSLKRLHELKQDQYINHEILFEHEITRNTRNTLTMFQPRVSHTSRWTSLATSPLHTSDMSSPISTPTAYMSLSSSPIKSPSLSNTIPRLKRRHSEDKVDLRLVKKVDVLSTSEDALLDGMVWMLPTVFSHRRTASPIATTTTQLRSRQLSFGATSAKTSLPLQNGFFRRLTLT